MQIACILDSPNEIIFAYIQKEKKEQFDKVPNLIPNHLPINHKCLHQQQSGPTQVYIGFKYKEKCAMCHKY